MINPFERFYDTEIEVYEVGENTYEKKGEKTLLGSVVCDIPVSYTHLDVYKRQVLY